MNNGERLTIILVLVSLAGYGVLPWWVVLGCFLAGWIINIVPLLRKRKVWTFHCPYCHRQTIGRIVRNGLFTQRCQQCGRVFPALGGWESGGRARAIYHPDCDQGCTFMEPYGWVISADCTLHNEIPGSG